MSALISYPTVKNAIKKSATEIEKYDLCGDESFDYTISNEFVVVPYI